MADPEKFLIRWKGKQSGPFTRAEIEEKLHQREISLFHEVLVNDRWTAVKEFTELGRPKLPQAPQQGEKTHVSTAAPRKAAPGARIALPAAAVPAKPESRPLFLAIGLGSGAAVALVVVVLVVRAVWSGGQASVSPPSPVASVTTSSRTNATAAPTPPPPSATPTAPPPATAPAQPQTPVVVVNIPMMPYPGGVPSANAPPAQSQPAAAAPASGEARSGVGKNREELDASSADQGGLPLDRLRLAAATIVIEYEASNLNARREVEDIVRRNNKPSAGSLEITGKKRVSFGSCEAVRVQGGKIHFLSNAHCLGPAAVEKTAFYAEPILRISQFEAAIKLPSGEVRKILRFAVHPDNVDLAVLEVGAEGLKPGKDFILLHYREAVSLKQGDELVAVGTPNGLEGTMTFGRVSAFRKDGVCELIQTDTPINNGNSGGPLFVKKGEFYFWVGVNVMKLAAIGVEGLNFAIHARHVMPLRQYKWFPATPSGAAECVKEMRGIKVVGVSSSSATERRGPTRAKKKR